jgi:hypothetical protein
VARNTQPRLSFVTGAGFPPLDRPSGARLRLHGDVEPMRPEFGRSGTNLTRRSLPSQAPRIFSGDLAWRWLRPQRQLAVGVPVVVTVGRRAEWRRFSYALVGTIRPDGSDLWMAAIGTMTWMWVSAIVIPVGAEINSEIEHQTARDDGGVRKASRHARRHHGGYDRIRTVEGHEL